MTRAMETMRRWRSRSLQRPIIFAIEDLQ
jgi:hypothetical protein